ncbi:hypothetical protein V6N12_060606 [Hibiscus sabdariffa]|uniref:Uncharacterized protein n=1 Tax=Hibiscus sabdariffa TaxID=183260 RepID=A0ABR2D5T9_9ROSI
MSRFSITKMMLSDKSGIFTTNVPFFFVAERSVECMGNNIRIAVFCHSQENQVAITEAKIEIDLHPEGTKEWALLDVDHTSSLLGATEALKASTLRLPIVGKAIVDIQNLKDAVSSAVDVMHGMASSICSLSSEVKEVNSLVNELVSVAANERVLLEQCKDHLSMLAAIQVKLAFRFMFQAILRFIYSCGLLFMDCHFRLGQ